MKNCTKRRIIDFALKNHKKEILELFTEKDIIDYISFNMEQVYLSYGNEYVISSFNYYLDKSSVLGLDLGIKYDIMTHSITRKRGIV